MRAPGTRTSDYDFPLPSELVAQAPLDRRDASRLLVLERSTGRITHGGIGDLATLVRPGDAVVFNTTRVLRARLLGVRNSGAPAEILLLKALDGCRYEAMVNPGGKLKPGRMVHIAGGFDVEILEVTHRRTRIVRLHTEGPAAEAIERHGHIPLPPYITRGDTPIDAERYQTVYAHEPGSVAAPTAGLHFTPELLSAIDRRGARRVSVLLHVGAGTFKPVEVEDPGAHVMHEEWYALSEDAASALNETRASGGSIWAVGTTSCRALESALAGNDRFAPSSGDTSIFIRPPYRFRAVDKLLTNFHLPRSTLLMLVAAMAGYELTMQAYREAIDAGYRFYSYGDAMAVV